MDFFGAQDKANQRTRQFFLLFAIFLVLLSVFFGVISLLSLGYRDIFLSALERGDFMLLFASQPRLGTHLLGSIAAWMLFFSGASLIYYNRIRYEGGPGIAESMRGVLVDYNSKEYRQLINCVEEMAIASGVPMPKVYVIPEANVNAFTAGFSLGDTVVGVSQGAVEQLSRAELQGVIAHEFSHIVSGDTTLNARMLGVLYSFELLVLVGRHLGRTRGRNAMPFVLGGLFLIVSGMVSYWVSAIIKGAISRQREFYADAAAVQFTRNPHGIGGALLKATGNQPQTMEHRYRHMLFIDNVHASFAGLLASHPPLKRRLEAIYPNRRFDDIVENGLQNSQQEMAMPRFLNTSNKQAKNVVTPRVLPALNVQPQQLSLKHEASEIYSATAIIYAMFIAERHPGLRKHQLAFVKMHLDPRLYSHLCKHVLRAMWEEKLLVRYHIFQIAINTAADMGFTQKVELMRIIDGLVRMDNHIDLYEFSLLKVLRETLRVEQGPVKHRVTEKYLVRKFINFYVRELVHASDFEKIKNQIIDRIGLDIELGNPVDTPEEAYHLLLSLDHIKPASKKALAELLYIIGQSEHFRDKDRYLALSHIVLNALHIPGAEIVRPA